MEQSNVNLETLSYVLYILLVLMLVLMTFVVAISYFKYVNLTKLSDWKRVVEGKLASFIVDGPKEILGDQEFLKKIRNRSFRNTLLEALVAAHRKFSGQARRDLGELFTSLNLEGEVWRKINSGKPHLISVGIQDLALVSGVNRASELERFLKHSSMQVRHEAQFATVSFLGFGGLSFLNSLEHNLSDWQQLRLLRAIKEIPAEGDDSLRIWLGSKNFSIVIFSLRVLKKFQRFSFYDKVKPLMQHSSDGVRMEVVAVMNALGGTTLTADLLRLYPGQSKIVQYEILKVFRSLRDKDTADLLRNLLEHHPEPAFQILSAEILLSIGYGDYLLRLAEKHGATNRVDQIIKHAFN